MMPRNLIFVRHGQSEGNVANRAARNGDQSFFTKEHRNRHSSQFRLTDKGREQAKWAGEYIRSMGLRVRRKYSSPYLRAMETMGLLSLGGPNTMAADELRERDWGELDVVSHEERWEKYGNVLRRQEFDPYLWTPPGGEPLVWVKTRVRDILNTISRECGDMELVVCVCHAEVMEVARVALERKLPRDYLAMKNDPEQDIPNCSILHYTRDNPFHSVDSCSYLNWVSLTTELDQNAKETGRVGFRWKEIIRPTFSDEEIIKYAEQYPRIIEG